MDNLEQLIDSNDAERYRDEAALQDKIREIFARGIIQAEAMNFIRGRSIAQTYLIIDEAQNMTPGAGQGRDHARGQGDQDHPAGRPGPDRPALSGRAHQRPELRGGAHAGQPAVLAARRWAPGECERSPLAMDAIHRL